MDILPYFLEEDEDVLLYILDMSKGRQRTYHNLKKSTNKFNLDELTDDYCWTHFRFKKEGLLRLVVGLEIPEFVKCKNGTVFPGMEGMCILLKRLVYPGRLADLMKYFPRTMCDLSRILNKMTRLIIDQHGHKLHDLNQTWLDEPRLEEFCRVISEKGSPYAECVGFLDGTVRPICRPQRNQREYYNGHRRVHALKFQSVHYPNGLIGDLYGPIHGRRHDAFVLQRSGLLDQMENKFVSQGGKKYHLYADAAYPLHPHLFTPFHIHNLNQQRTFCNKRMSRLRVGVEWGFGKVIRYFAFLDFKKNLKIGKQPVHSFYLVGAILTNCHTCLYGSQTSEYFDCNPPSLEEYLA